MAPFTASTMNIKIFQALTPRTIGSLVCSNICLWHVQSGAISSHNRVRDTACSVVAYPDHKGVMRASASLAPKHRLTMASTQHLAAVHFDWVRKWWHNGTIVLKGTQQPERCHSDEERRSFNHRWLGVSEATRNNLTMSDFKDVLGESCPQVLPSVCASQITGMTTVGVGPFQDPMPSLHVCKECCKAWGGSRGTDGFPLTCTCRQMGCALVHVHKLCG